MKCDVCDKEFANSEEVKLHKEREHPMDERGDEQLEAPDNAGSDTEPTRPDPIVRPRA